MKIAITKGKSSAPTQLAAFDGALYQAGISNYNLIRLSSIIPPDSQIVTSPEELRALKAPGGWGDRLYVVIAENRTDKPGEEVWAGIGWVQDPVTKKGLFVEHEGPTEESVRSDINASLSFLTSVRNIDYGPVQMIVNGAVCQDEPVCTLVAAVYQASDWQNTPSFIEDKL